MGINEVTWNSQNDSYVNLCRLMSERFTFLQNSGNSTLYF